MKQIQIIARCRETGVTAALLLETDKEWVPLDIQQDTRGFLPDLIYRVAIGDEVGSSDLKVETIGGDFIRIKKI